MNSRERVFEFLEGRSVDHIPAMPITMMYAADQIGASYGEYARNHEVLVSAQIETARRFGFDYVSCISDPAREAHDCGAAIHFYDDQPPAIDEKNALLSDKGRLSSLEVPDPLKGLRMADRVAAAARFKELVGDEFLIEGWIEGPCAEGADLRGINRLMLDFYDDPDFVLELFEFILEMELRFARAQSEAGADLIGIGDAASSLVGPKIYREFVYPYQKRMVETLRSEGMRVRMHICGNIRSILEELGSLECDILDLDYPVPVVEAREKVGPGQVLLGNISPVDVLLNGMVEDVREGLEKCWKAANPRYIVGAGCEIPRGTPAENVHAMIEFARALQPSTEDRLSR